MKFYIRFVLGLTLVIIVSSCGTSKSINTLKPEADLAAPLKYEKEVSHLSIPVSIKLRELENQTNLSIKGLIYEDKNLSDDNVMLKVWKQAPISITNEKGKLKVVLPLKIWAKISYGGNVFGMNIYDEREINLNGIATLVSDAKFSNWQLKTASVVESIVWKESPSITIAGKSMPITYLVNPALKYFKSTIEEKIDESIASSMNFQADILDALTKITAPIKVNESYDTWFKIHPIGLNATESKLSKDAVLLDLDLACYMESFIGKPANSIVKKESIKLTTVSKINEQFLASLIVVSPFLKASEIITKNFENQEFASGSKKVIVKKVDLWHKNGKIIIALGMEGSINGTIYLSGIPKYDAVNELIYFDELAYILETKNALLKTANWLAQGIILKKIKEATSYSIKPEMQLAKSQMEQYLKNYTLSKGIRINGTLGSIVIDKIQLTDQAVVATIKTSGKVLVNIDGM